MSITIVLAALLTVCAQHKPTPEEAFGQSGASAEAEALVKRVKEQLAAVDLALQAAAEADRAATDLNAARKAHLSVIRDIEELIKQVKYSESQSQSNSGGGGQSGGGGSSDTPRPDARESDGQEQSGAKPPQSKPQGEQPQDAESQAGDPQSGQPDQQQPSQQPGDQPPPPPEAGRFERQDTDARWGLLPPKVQERLMNLHVDDLPERYRTWMDAYIRELNRLEQGASRP